MNKKGVPYWTQEDWDEWLERISVPTLADLPKNPSIGDFRYVKSNDLLYFYGHNDDWFPNLDKMGQITIGGDVYTIQLRRIRRDGD